jgi:hypothetical protein
MPCPVTTILLRYSTVPCLKTHPHEKTQRTNSTVIINFSQTGHQAAMFYNTIMEYEDPVKSEVWCVVFNDLESMVDTPLSAGKQQFFSLMEYSFYGLQYMLLL